MIERSRFDADHAREFPAHFASQLVGGELREVADVLNALPHDAALAVARKLPIAQLRALAGSEKLRMEALFSGVKTDEAIAVISRLPREQAQALVNQMKDSSQRKRLLQFLNYPAHSVGAVVQTAKYLFDVDDRIADVRSALHDDEQEPRAIVVDKDGHYAGILDPWRLLRAEADSLLAHQCVDTVEPLRPEFSKVSASTNAQWAERAWLPVVDQRNRVIGICERDRLTHGAMASGAVARPPLAEAAALGFVVIQAFGIVLDAVLRRPDP